MTATFTIIDDPTSANDSSGRKRIFGTISFTNPYTANGDSFSLSTYFPNKFLGGRVVAINPSSTTALAGLLTHATFRADTSSTATAVIQLFSAGLSATANAGNLVDNTTANISGLTCTIEAFGY